MMIDPPRPPATRYGIAALQDRLQPGVIADAGLAHDDAAVERFDLLDGFG